MVEIKFDIDDNKVNCFIDGAKDELKTNAKNHVLTIIDEAVRIEASLNADTQPVITPSHVKQAVVKTKTHPSRKHGWWYIICQTIAWIGTLIAGGLLDVEAFKTNTFQMLAFIIISIVSAGCLLATLFANHYER